MENEIQKLYNLPEISFVGGITYEGILNQMIADYEKCYEENTGRKIVLRPGDKEHIHLRINAGQYFQMYHRLDYAAKMNLLKYSTGDFLKHLGALKRTFVQEPRAAVCTARFTLSEVRKEIIYIPKGTRITAGDGVYFATDDYAEISAGDSYVDIDCTCETAGTTGNEYGPGRLEIIVDPVPYVESVTNITKTEGGSGEESEESFRERIFLAPSSYSVAGPPDAYEYWVKQFNSAAIEDVKIYEPPEAVVDIRILLLGGILPSEAFCSDCLEYLKEHPIVPLTDHVFVSPPDVVEYGLKATYYISRSDIRNINAIRDSIESAKDTYLNWQKTKIGRDLNPDALTEFVRAAGGKRVVIESPVFTVIPETSVAMETSVEFVYGGVEDD
ncbi:MAG: phage tail protein [Eubacterium sp.]|nr:phage tail protein [Eubacterium sp.]